MHIGMQYNFLVEFGDLRLETIEIKKKRRQYHTTKRKLIRFFQ